MRIPRHALITIVVLLTLTALLLGGCSRATPPEESGPEVGVEIIAAPGSEIAARNAIPGETPSDIGETEEQRELRRTGTGEQTGGALVPIYFNFDRSEVRADQVERLENNASYLLANPGQKILVEGHCDNRGTVEYNFALGARRANTIKEFLVSRNVAPARVSTISKGEEEPAVKGKSEEAYALNRRGEFKFLR